MLRVARQGLCIVLLIAGACYAQSVADAARENRKQKSANGAATKVISNDDLFGEPEVIQLLPGSSSRGEGTLVAPGRGKHDYRIVKLDASRFVNGGTMHITITMGDGKSEASFDLYPQGFTPPSEGSPNSLAGAYNVARTNGAKIRYRFSHGEVYQLGAEGSWNAKAGDANTYRFVVEVEENSAH